MSMPNQLRCEAGQAPGLPTRRTQMPATSIAKLLIVDDEAALMEAGIAIEEVDDVLLIGGVTRMPQVRERLETLFGKRPLAFHASILGLIALMPYALARIYAGLALALVALHVAAGIIVGGGDWSDFAALLSAPFYIVWKLAALSKTVQSARSAAPWIRTDR